MDGADHVNRVKMPIERLKTLNLKNGRLLLCHAKESNGQES
jgi:flagellar biosynthesis/type III secretory pathway chaperone